MKNYRLIVFVVFSLLFTSCSYNENKTYVKDILLSKKEDVFTLNIKYYDFNEKTETFVTKEYSSRDTENLGTKAMEDINFNFRLCENVFLSENILDSDLQQAFDLLTGLKIPPTAQIFAVTDREIINQKDFKTPIKNRMFDFSLNNKKVNGCIPVLSESGEIISAAVTVDNQITERLSREDFTVLRMITGDTEKTEYSFNNNKMWAYLSVENLFFSCKDKILNINLCLNIKEYKGLYSSIGEKEKFARLLEKDICTRITDLYESYTTVTSQRLDWASSQAGIKATGIDVQVEVK